MWQTFESYKVFCAWSIFSLWHFSAGTPYKRRKDLAFAVLCPLGLALLVGFSIPTESWKENIRNFLSR
ncbi:hypothetical protein ACNKHM_22150 [Shigella sonnei]